MLLTKAAQVYLTVGCELGTITHNLLWQMFSSSSHPDTLSTAAAWAGNRVFVAFQQEIVFWPDNSDNANKRTQGSHSLPHYIMKWCTDLYSYLQRAAPTAGLQLPPPQFLLKQGCVPLASGPQCARDRENRSQDMTRRSWSRHKWTPDPSSSPQHTAGNSCRCIHSEDYVSK